MVDGVTLPAGRRVDELLWMTQQPPEDAVGLWSAIAARFDETGLWPLVVFGYDGDWDLFQELRRTLG